jgi:hypothetical protein
MVTAVGKAVNEPALSNSARLPPPGRKVFDALLDMAIQAFSPTDRECECPR